MRERDKKGNQNDEASQKATPRCNIHCNTDCKTHRLQKRLQDIHTARQTARRVGRQRDREDQASQRPRPQNPEQANREKSASAPLPSHSSPSFSDCLSHTYVWHDSCT